MTAMETAIHLAHSGLSVIPIRADGTKAPACKSWTEFQKRIASEVEIREMFGGNVGVAIVAGEASGNLEVLDIEADAPFGDLSSLVTEYDSQLITLLPHVETPSGGHHLFYRCTDIGGNQKLAMRTNPAGGTKVLIETRGRGGYVVTVGSPSACHPTNKEYRLVNGSLLEIPWITPDQRSLLLDAARSFNRMWKEPHGLTPAISNDCGNGSRPGDLFNTQATWEEILQPHGWTAVSNRGGISYWRRPGKAIGISATTNYGGFDRLHVFSTNAAPFEAETSYSKFAAYAVLNYHGDFKAAARSLGKQPEPPETSASGVEKNSKPIVIRLADVEAEEVHWLWPDRLAAGKLSLLIGDPGNGKSTALLDLACRITRGAELPGGGQPETGSIIILTAEDGLADTVRPRVNIHGGDATQFHVLQGVHTGDDERPFSLETDIAQLEGVIEGIRDVRMIIIDPLSAYLGDRDSYKDSHIRVILTPLAKLAERRGVAVVGIAHLTKATDRKALYRTLGSVAFVAAARTVFAIGRDPENEMRRILVCVKNNLAPHPPALAFSIVEDGGRGRLEWEKEPIIGIDAESVLSAVQNANEREEHQDAEAFLKELLVDGQLPTIDVLKAGRQNGFSEATLKRAKSRLGIQALHVGQPGTPGKWYWYLPKGITNHPKGIKSGEVIPFEQTKDVTADTSISSSKGITSAPVISFDGESERLPQSSREEI